MSLSRIASSCPRAGHVKQSHKGGRTVYLAVTVPPSVANVNVVEELTVIENRTIQIDCPVSGVPPPSIMWLKDRQPLLDFPYPRLRLLAGGRQLELRDVKVGAE